jgi:hypothetical protein
LWSYVNARIREWEDAYLQAPQLQLAFKQSLKEIDWDLNAEQVVTAYAPGPQTHKIERHGPW